MGDMTEDDVEDIVGLGFWLIIHFLVNLLLTNIYQWLNHSKLIL